MNTRCGNCDHFVPYDGHLTGTCLLHKKCVRAATKDRKCFITEEYLDIVNQKAISDSFRNKED